MQLARTTFLMDETPIQLQKRFVDPPKPSRPESPRDQTISAREVCVIFGVVIFVAAFLILLAPFFLYDATLQFVVASLAAVIVLLTMISFFL